MGPTPNATVKVGNKQQNVSSNVVPINEKKERAVFDLTTALDGNGQPIALEEDRLTDIPHNVPAGTERLKRSSFTTRLLYAQWQRYLLELQEAKVLARIKDKDAEIEEIKTGGDPKVKKVRQAKKLVAQVNALLESLKADGIDPASIGLNI